MAKQIPQGYKQTKVGVIPEDWNVVKLGDIAKFYKGKGISKENLSASGTPCIRYGELYTTYNEKIDTVISKTNLCVSELFLSKANDIIIPASGETAIDIATASCVLQDNIALGGDLNIIRTKHNGVFLSYYLNIVVKNKIASLAQGISVIHLYSSQLETLLLSLPPIEEQEKIVEILSTWDDVIAKQEQLIKQKQVFKKGIMQQIFNQKLRFKDDNSNNYPAWQLKKLSDFLIFTPREVEKPKVPYLAIGVRSHAKGTFQKQNTEPSANVMDTMYLVRKDDLIINITFAWEGAIAIVKSSDDGGYVSHRFPTYTFNVSIMISRFFKFIICRKHFISMLDLISPGGAGRNRVLSKSSFMNLKIDLPCVNEQNKIADFLTGIDDEITKQIEILAQLKLQKQALMQKLLTGQVRV